MLDEAQTQEPNRLLPPRFNHMSFSPIPNPAKTHELPAQNKHLVKRGACLLVLDTLNELEEESSLCLIWRRRYANQISKQNAGYVRRTSGFLGVSA